MSYDSPTTYLRALEHDPSLAIMSVQMVAEFRGVTRAAIDRLLRLGRLEEIKVGKTRYVRASSVVALQSGEDERIAKVKRYLEDCAREGTHHLFYDPVMSSVGLSWQVPNDRWVIGVILGEISRQTWRDHRIVLSVLVHKKTPGVTKPGPGFFGLFDEDEFAEFEEWDDDAELVERETQKVLRFYRNQ